MDWQPIETAPKDGTSILLWGDWLKTPCVDNGSEDGTFGAFTSQTGYESVHPTHWMPLPKPPHEEGV